MKDNSVKTILGLLTVLGGGTVVFLLGATHENTKATSKHEIKICNIEKDISEIKVDIKELLKISYSMNKRLP